MARVGRFLGWAAGILAVAVFAVYAMGPIDAFPGMRLGGTPTDARVRIGDATFAVRAVAIDDESTNKAVGIAYRAKYAHYINAEKYGQAMADAAAEVLDDARRAPVFQLLRLDPAE